MDGWQFVLGLCAIVGASVILRYVVSVVAVNVRAILRELPRVTVYVPGLPPLGRTSDEAGMIRGDEPAELPGEHDRRERLQAHGRGDR